MSIEEATESIQLAMGGFEHDIEASITTFFKSATVENVEKLLQDEFSKFVANEAVFKGLEEADVVLSLAKANKDKIQTIIPALLARKQLKFRASAILSLLRQLEFMPERFKGYALTYDNMSDILKKALVGLSELEGVIYGPIALKARQIMDNAKMPAFLSRLDALKAQLLAPNVDLISLSRQPNIAVSVDLLVVLMSDASVSKAAAEVYIRRVYRAHKIKS